MSQFEQRENSGALFVNDKKSHEKQPDFTGTINVGGLDFYISAWKKQGASGVKFMSLAVTEKQERQEQPQRQQQAPQRPGQQRPTSKPDDPFGDNW